MKIVENTTLLTHPMATPVAAKAGVDSFIRAAFNADIIDEG